MTVYTKLLLVEGSDDQVFFEAFLKKKAIVNIKVENFDGKDNLKKFLHGLPDRPDFSQFTAIGITRDADSRPGLDVFNSTCQMLKNTKFAIPAFFGKFTEENTSSPRVGVFILPGENETGELEDLLFKTILDKNEIKDCVSQYITCVKSKKDSLKKPAKAQLYAWLACQDSSSPLRVKDAVKNSDLFNFDCESLSNLSQFLDDLSGN